MCMKTSEVIKKVYDIAENVIYSEPVKTLKQACKDSTVSKKINELKNTVREDVRTVKERDPAARNAFEICLNKIQECKILLLR